MGEEGDLFRFWDPSVSDRLWGEAEVPSCFEQIHGGLSGYEGAVWFRRKFRVPWEWGKGGRLWLRFEGVNDRARVWLNGRWLGSFPDPFLPFGFDGTAWIDWANENLLVVEVSNKPLPEEVPGMHVGWRRQGGITRDVALEWRPDLYVEGLTLEPDAATGSVRVLVTVRNGGDSLVEDGRIVLVIYGPEGEEKWAAHSQVEPVVSGGTVPCEFQGRVEKVQRWSPSAPRLYRAVIRVGGRGSAEDRVEQRFGFRTFERKPDGIRLNGERIFLTGFNRHEDWPSKGSVFDEKRVRQDLERMKEAGANFIRLCHYPHHPGELDLCDELGLMVLAEIPLYFWADRDLGRRHQTAREAAGLRQLRAMIARDRHHPSIAFWSVSNETDEDDPEVAAMNRRLIREAKRLDPSRLCVHVSNHWTDCPNFEEDDVIAVNWYPSLRWADRGKGPSYDGEGAAGEWRLALERLRCRYPNKPVLITEFGGASWEGVREGVFGEDRHARQLEVEFLALDRPYVCGAAVWCWADHAWPPGRFFGGLGISPFGVLTRDRRTKRAYHAICRLFRQRHNCWEAPSATPVRPSTSVLMVRPHLQDIPEALFPEGFGMRPMRREDVGLWTDIERDAEPFFTIPDDLFAREFGEDWPAIERRCFIVIDPKGLGVGTISAWRNWDFRGEDYGRIHWVAVRPAWQRRGLARAALAAALRILAQWHRKAYLVTQTERLGAIRLYLDFGFLPDIASEEDRARWESVRARLRHPLLESGLWGRIA